jgi:hypothetical protein
MSWDNDPCSHPLPFECTYILLQAPHKSRCMTTTWLTNCTDAPPGKDFIYQSSTTGSPSVPPPQYTPLRFAPSLNLAPQWPLSHSQSMGPGSMVENFENIPPMSVPSPHGEKGSALKRRRDEPAQTYTGDKRPRQGQAHAHLNQRPEQSRTSYDPTQSTSLAPSRMYDPSVGTYVHLPQESATSAAPDSYVTFRAPSLPGAARYEQQLLESCGPTPTSFTTFAHNSYLPERAAVQPSNSLSFAKHQPHQQHNQREMFHDPKSSVPKQHTGISEIPRGTQQNPVELLSSPEPEVSITKSKKKRGKNKFYAVAAGHVPGIYTEWSDVERQIKGYSGNSHHGFATETEARAWLEEHGTVSKAHSDHSYTTDRAPHRKSSHLDPAVEQLTHETLLSSDGYSNLTPADGVKMQSSSDAPEFIPFPPTSQWAVPPQYQTSAVGANADVVPIVEPPLCKEQADLVDLILSRRNVFYTGSAGCGKFP